MASEDVDTSGWPVCGKCGLEIEPCRWEAHQELETEAHWGRFWLWVFWPIWLVRKLVRGFRHPKQIGS